MSAHLDVRLEPIAVERSAYRRRVIFECCKWDPQVGDVCTISDYRCVVAPEAAAHLRDTAEKLAAETIALEAALAERPDLWPGLGLSARLRSALAGNAQYGGVRVMRFDFHPTAEGWALSEVNSDVPGGFAEASALPRIAASPAAHPFGDVAHAIVARMRPRLEPRARVAFVHATAYADDRQVMQFLANRFAAAGFEALLVAPDHLRWSEAGAYCVADGQAGSVHGVVRFFPADWLTDLPPGSDWRGYFRSALPMCNPPRAVLTQSKRLPLVWDRLGVDAPTWRVALPETRDPRDAPWRSDESWLVKPAWGRVGEGVAWRGSAVPAKTWRRIALSATLRPRQWIAQRRFVGRPLASADGEPHLCIGVFTVDGVASGFYGRLSHAAVIGQHAQETPVLVAHAQGERHAA